MFTPYFIELHLFNNLLPDLHTTSELRRSESDKSALSSWE